MPKLSKPDKPAIAANNPNAAILITKIPAHNKPDTSSYFFSNAFTTSSYVTPSFHNFSFNKC